MKVVYTGNQPKHRPTDIHSFNSLFLIGPTPRLQSIPSWRPEALDILSRLKFKGYVFVPEYESESEILSLEERCKWEHYCLHFCRRLVCWVPRTLTYMPAFTTNVEFGFCLGSRPDAFYYGRPFWAKECDYLDWLYTDITLRKPADNLLSLLEEVLRT